MAKRAPVTGSRSPLLHTLGFVVRHPANRRRPIRALLTFAGWQVWKRTTGRSLTVTFWAGLRIRIYPDNRSASLALYTGLPEYDDMLFALRLLRPGDCVIDVGANIGLYSLLAASRIGDGRVIALEPDPLTAARLRENTELNRLRNVEVRVEAAGAEHGHARLTTGLDAENYIVGEGSTAATTTVLVSALDDLVDPGAQVALVKLDVEGFESEVLRGAGRLLTEGLVMAWIVETSGLGLRYGVEDQTVIEMFVSRGYHPFHYDSDNGLLQPVAGPTGETGRNLIFVKDAGAVRDRLGSSKT